MTLYRSPKPNVQTRRAQVESANVKQLGRTLALSYCINVVISSCTLIQLRLYCAVVYVWNKRYIVIVSIEKKS